MGKKALVFGEVGDETFDGATDLGNGMLAKHIYGNCESCAARSYHGIFPHEDNALDLALASQALSDLVHLLGADIVDGDNKD